MSLATFLFGKSDEQDPELSVSPRSKYNLQRHRIIKMSSVVEDMRVLGLDFKVRKSSEFVCAITGEYVESMESKIKYCTMDCSMQFNKFQVLIEEGGKVGPQVFPEEDMMIKVIKGEIIDDVTRKKYTEGDIYRIPAGQKHVLTATIPADLTILYSIADIK